MSSFTYAAYDNDEQQVADPDSPFGGIPRDENGNIIANVNHRTGTLASLLALDGGNGEISVATDKRALVRHNGVMGGAQAFYASGVIHTAICSGGQATAAPGVATHLPIDTADVDPFGIVDTVNNVVALPANMTPGKYLFGLVTASVTFAGVTGGTYRKVWIEMDITGSGGWAPCSGIVERPATSSDTTMSVTGLSPQAVIGSVTKIRVMAQHDDVTNRQPGIILLSVLAIQQ